ncbi:MAG: hypothetical protein LIP77_03355 [Planctomycetes bacterium]|nr:hypothetical protein [Planctomycetota bacterium]
MLNIFPPSGSQDEARYQAIKEEEREYLWFCVEFCGRILQKRPAQLEALEVAANHFTALGYYHDGLRLDERLAALKPDDPQILYNLACSLALTGNTDAAIFELGRAVRNGYRDFRHMAADEDLGNLKDDPRFQEILAMGGAGGRDDG